jgi:hypothetical protein
MLDEYEAPAPGANAAAMTSKTRSLTMDAELGYGEQVNTYRKENLGEGRCVH